MVVNLYPFAQTVRELSRAWTRRSRDRHRRCGAPACRGEELPGVAAVSSPTQYGIGPARHQDPRQRQPGDPPELAAEAFAATASYDTEIASHPTRSRTVFPNRLTIRQEEGGPALRREPASARRLLHDPAHAGGSLSAAHQIAGKDLSSPTCSTSTRRGWIAATSDPAVTIVKHGNPCGLASVVDLAEAFRLALEGDSVPPTAGSSASTADRRADRPGHPPASSRRSSQITRPRRSRSSRRSEACDHRGPTGTGGGELGSATSTSSGSAAGCWCKRATRCGGPDMLPPVTTRRPTLAELTSLLFAWRAVGTSTRTESCSPRAAMVGLGAGQPCGRQRRPGAAEGRQALCSPFMASDAFFPFPDGIERAAASRA